METLTSVKTNFHQFLDKPRVYADLNGGWQEGDDYIVPLNSTGTELDIHLLGYTLKPNLVLDFWTDDGDDEGNPDPLVFQGKIGFDEGQQKWYAVTRKDGFHHASDLTKPQVQPVRSAERELTAHTR